MESSETDKTTFTKRDKDYTRRVRTRVSRPRQTVGVSNMELFGAHGIASATGVRLTLNRTKTKPITCCFPRKTRRLIVCVCNTLSRKKTGRLSLNKSETSSLILLSGLLVEPLIILVYYLPFFLLRLAHVCTLESPTSRISLVFNLLVAFGVRFVVKGLRPIRRATVVMFTLPIN
jgi:hypothetical protein